MIGRHFQRIKGDVVKQLIILLSPADRKEACTWATPDSVGRLMTPDYITVRNIGHASRA